MTEGHVPELRLSANAEASMVEHGILAWIPLFSILFDPGVDGEFKRRHASDMILFADDGLYIAYRVLANGDLYIAFVHYEADVDSL